MAVSAPWALSQATRVQVDEGWYFETGQVFVGTTPVLVVDENPRRTSVIIANTGADVVYIVNSQQGTAGGGHILFPGGSLSTATRAAIWAIAVTGTYLLTYLEEMA